jgi:PAS domain S-box-containing protein
MGRSAHLCNVQKAMDSAGSASLFFAEPSMSRIEMLPLGLNGLALAWESVGVVVAALLLGLAGGLLWRARAERRRRAPAAEGRLHERELATLRRIASDLARAGDVEAVVRTLLDEIAGLFEVGFVALTFVSEEGNEASGYLARARGADVDWWRDVRVDLHNEPSGIASVVFEASAFTVYDVAGNARVSARLAQAVGAKSAAYIPLISSERVIAVISVATTDNYRAFSADELASMQALASEATIALERTRSSLALRDALERERLLATIARRLRTELDLREALAATVAETARALGASHCSVALGDETLAGWGAAGEGDASQSASIVVDGDSVGTIEAARQSSRPWTPRDTALLDSVAAEVALAVRLGRLLEENRDRLDQQTSLLRAAQVLTGALDLDEVLQRFADEVARLLEADAADCYLYENGVLRCAAVHGLDPSLVGFEFPATRGLAGVAIREVRSLALSRYTELEHGVPHPQYEGFTDAVVAPMRWSDDVQGVLGAGRRDGHHFDARDTEALEAFAGLASLALRNAETFTRSARQARVQRGFYRVASILGQSLSRTATLDAVAQAAAEALGGGAAAVLMPQRGRLTIAGSHNIPGALPRSIAGDGTLARASAEGRIVAAPRLADDERLPDEWRDAAFGALVAIPVEAPRSQTGGLVVVFFTAEHVFTDEDLELARHLAEAARGALERSELFEAERSARALAQQLTRTGRLLTTELDPAAVLDEVVQQAPELVNADACAIRVLEEDELVVHAAVGAGAEAALGTRSPASAWLSGDVVQSRAPVALENAAADPRLAALDPMLAGGSASYLGVPLAGPEGSPLGVLAVYCTEPRPWREEEIEAMLALAASTSAALSNAELYQRVALEKERSVAILANIADGIVAVDREGRVVLWNRAAEQVTGIPAEDALGRTPADVLQRALDSGSDTPVGDRLVSINRGREEVWLSVTEAVMRDPAGAVAGRIFAFRDISTDRLVEQMKSDFVSTVSHELRTPLTSIYGFAETLLRQDVLFGDDERRTFLSYIASESQRLTQIVDALLNVARLDTGDLHVNLSSTDVRDVVGDVLDTVRTATPNGHRFVVELPEEPVAANADRDKLRQVCTILLDNAIKYSPEGGTVTVGVERGRDVVQVSVADEGVGIPQAEQEQIFRKFYRGTDADSRVGQGGTGLGLFIARGLVTAMGGRIWVESREGEGSTFAIELPAAGITQAR